MSEIDIPLAIAGVGLAGVSVWACVNSKGEIGGGWAAIAVLCLLSMKGCQ